MIAAEYMGEQTMTLADAVRELRRERDWTQQQAADAVTAATGRLMRQGMIANIERGKHTNPTERLINALAVGFGITPTELRQAAGLAEPPDINQLLAAGALPQHLQLLLRQYERLTPDDRRMVDTMVSRLAEQRAERDQGAATPAENEGDTQGRRRRRQPPVEPPERISARGRLRPLRI